RLYQASRAYAFWSLETFSLSTSDLDIATLANTYATLSDKITAAQEGGDETPQPFTQEVVLKASDYPIPFQGLPAAKKLTFEILPKQSGFANMYQVIAQRLTVKLPDVPATATGTASLNLVHAGASTFVGRDHVSS